MFNIISEVPLFISKQHHSLFRFHEHGFEAVHKQLAMFEKKYSIPSAEELTPSSSSVSAAASQSITAPDPAAATTRVTRSQSRSESSRSRSQPSSSRSRSSHSQSSSQDADYTPLSQPARKRRRQEQQNEIQSNPFRALLLAQSPYNVDASSRSRTDPVREKKEVIRGKRLSAFNAFNARQFPADSIGNLRYCAEFNAQFNKYAPWNSMFFAKYRVMKNI